MSRIVSFVEKDGKLFGITNTGTEIGIQVEKIVKTSDAITETDPKKSESEFEKTLKSYFWDLDFQNIQKYGKDYINDTPSFLLEPAYHARIVQECRTDIIDFLLSEKYEEILPCILDSDSKTMRDRCFQYCIKNKRFDIFKDIRGFATRKTIESEIQRYVLKGNSNLLRYIVDNQCCDPDILSEILDDSIVMGLYENVKILIDKDIKATTGDVINRAAIAGNYNVLELLRRKYSIMYSEIFHGDGKWSMKAVIELNDLELAKIFLKTGWKITSSEFLLAKAMKEQHFLTLFKSYGYIYEYKDLEDDETKLQFHSPTRIGQCLLDSKDDVKNLKFILK